MVGGVVGGVVGGWLVALTCFFFACHSFLRLFHCNLVQLRRIDEGGCVDVCIEYCFRRTAIEIHYCDCVDNFPGQ